MYQKGKKMAKLIHRVRAASIITITNRSLFVPSLNRHNLSGFFNNMIIKPQNQNRNLSSSSSSKVEKFRHVLQSRSTDGWDKCWEEGLTPWDLGGPTPIIKHLHRTGSLPKGRALVPGCGSGHDVVAIACPERYVVGLDISEKAIKHAIELSAGSSKAENFTFIRTDFFTWHPTELFDLIFDYTFFCAIEPHMRPQWAKKVCDLLKPEGELITLMYPIDDHNGGPPYKVSVTAYEEALHPVGLRATHVGDNEMVIAPRRGREKLGRWKRIVTQSSL